MDARLGGICETLGGVVNLLLYFRSNICDLYCSSTELNRYTISGASDLTLLPFG